MKSYTAGRDFVLILEKGEELMVQLTEFAKSEHITAAWLSGLGAALEAELGFYDLEAQKYLWQKFDGPLEITGLHGNITRKNNQPVMHVHATLAGKDYRAVGGHVKRLVVAGTCEILIQKLGAKLERQPDEQTGLDLL